MKATTIMFDLDGTLIDSRPGIIHSLRLSLSELGHPVDDSTDLTHYIGASLWQIYGEVLNTSDRVVLDKAVSLYRHIYRDGPMFEFTVYDGVKQALKDLKMSGARIVIATAKAHEYAREVVDESTFGEYIDHVYGSELDGTNVEKADLIRHVLREESASPLSAVMVGDRHHDINGALANGTACVGVTYGYGEREELLQATRIIDSATELVHTITEMRSPDR